MTKVHRLGEFQLKPKERRLLQKIKARPRFGVYYDEMTQSERALIKRLLAYGLVVRTAGSWTGDEIYKPSPHLTQTSGQSS